MGVEHDDALYHPTSESQVRFTLVVWVVQSVRALLAAEVVTVVQSWFHTIMVMVIVWS